MSKQLTEEELELLNKMADDDEFIQWVREQGDSLRTYYDTQPYPVTYHTLGGFAMHCVKEYQKFKEGSEGV